MSRYSEDRQESVAKTGVAFVVISAIMGALFGLAFAAMALMNTWGTERFTQAIWLAAAAFVITTLGWVRASTDRYLLSALAWGMAGSILGAGCAGLALTDLPTQAFFWVMTQVGVQ